MRESRLARITLLVLFWANFLNFLDRQVVAALAPLLKAHWQLSDYQVGLLATAFEVPYALAPVPIAILGDRWTRRRIVALAVSLWSAAMALGGAAVSYAMLLGGRALLGLGQAGYGPSALAWLSDLYPSSHRSRVVSIHDLALMLGSAAGFALGGLVGRALGWRPVFYLAAAPGLALAVAIWLLPEPPKGLSDYRTLGLRPEDAVTAELPFGRVLRELLSVPTLIVIYVVAVLLNAATAGLVYWLPSFAVRYHGFHEGQAGLLIGALTVVAGGSGILVGGYLADRLLQRTVAARLLTVSLSFAAGFPLAMVALFAPGRGLFLGAAALAVALFTFYFPCLAPLVHQVTPPELRATAMGIALFVIHILANAPAPALVGWLSDQTGDLRWGLAAALLTGLLVVAVGLWGTRFVRADTQRMQEGLERRLEQGH
jgi:MFS transporter, Spinster family, sphingosine-1-phosphate transporter